MGVATGEGFLIATPLFQTSFVPDLMQVNFFPDAVAVDPAFVHLVPALGAAACKGPAIPNKAITKDAKNFLNCMLLG
jgi:hypothetical protein